MFYFGHQFHIGGSHAYHFHYLRSSTLGLIDPRSFEAIKRSPQNQISWSAGLEITMKLVLQKLVNLSWTVEFWHVYPRRRFCAPWRKPVKPTSLNFLRQLPNPITSHNDAYYACIRHGYSQHEAHRISTRRQRCFILLKAVTLYLHKSNCTSEVAKLARKSLPKAALWFPRLMKRARTDMNTYALRWEGACSVTFLMVVYVMITLFLDSLNGISERAMLLSINDID
jgi:hypothetical protein